MANGRPTLRLDPRKLDELYDPIRGKAEDLLLVKRGALRLLIDSERELRRMETFRDKAALDHNLDVLR